MNDWRTTAILPPKGAGSFTRLLGGTRPLVDYERKHRSVHRGPQSRRAQGRTCMCSATPCDRRHADVRSASANPRPAACAASPPRCRVDVERAHQQPTHRATCRDAIACPVVAARARCPRRIAFIRGPRVIRRCSRRGCAVQHGPVPSQPTTSAVGAPGMVAPSTALRRSVTRVATYGMRTLRRPAAASAVNAPVNTCATLPFGRVRRHRQLHSAC